jgi:hypothetical protein
LTPLNDSVVEVPSRATGGHKKVEFVVCYPLDRESATELDPIRRWVSLKFLERRVVRSSRNNRDIANVPDRGIRGSLASWAEVPAVCLAGHLTRLSRVDYGRRESGHFKLAGPTESLGAPA